MASRANASLWRETVKAGAARSGALIVAIALVLATAAMALALVTYSPGDAALNTAAGEGVHNLLGSAGAWFAESTAWRPSLTSAEGHLLSLAAAAAVGAGAGRGGMGLDRPPQALNPVYAASRAGTLDNGRLCSAGSAPRIPTNTPDNG